nr:reverse transcriptase domain-containing protein [Tanacetum cinerariifolium]
MEGIEMKEMEMEEIEMEEMEIEEMEMVMGTEEDKAITSEDLCLLERNGLTAYTRRFQELVLLCTRMVPSKEDKVKRFIGGLPDNIQGDVIAAEPIQLQDTIRIANNLMTRGNEATATAYAIGEEGVNPDSNIVIDTSYAVELADGRILETNVVFRGCTLGLLGHPFDIDLMPIV